MILNYLTIFNAHIENDNGDKSPQERCGVLCGWGEPEDGDKRIVYACGITDYFFKMNIVLTTA